MLNLFFVDNNKRSETRIKEEAATRVSQRFLGRFEEKILQIETMLGECRDAQTAAGLERSFIERYDKMDARKAFVQIVNGFQMMLQSLVDAGCKKQNRYNRFVSLSNYLGFL